MEEAARTFWLTDGGVELLSNKLDKLHRIAEKLGVPGPKYIKKGYDFRSVRFVDDGPLVMVKFNEVEVTGIAPVLAGWQFVATIQHEQVEKAWSNVIRTVPGTTKEVEAGAFERYFHSAPLCEHCNKIRNRVDTYIVYDAEADAYRQVGSGCLRDFLGHRSPAAIAGYIEALWDMEDIETEEQERWRGGGYPRPEAYIDTEWYLSHVAAMIRTHGWWSKGQAEARGETPTSFDAMSNLHKQQMWNGKGKPDFEVPTAVDVKTAQDTLTYVREVLAANPQPGFESNLVTACSNKRTNMRNTGIVAAAISSWKRAVAKKVQQETEARNAAAANGGRGLEHVGTVGKRLEVEVTIVRIIEHESDWGVSNIHIMTDTSGNKLVWFASGGRSLGGAEQGWTGVITGTVKAHGTDRRSGQPETVLTRCKVA
jgi:hypothetical protein